MNDEDDFSTQITRNVVKFKTGERTVFVRRALLRESFISLEPSGSGSRLTIITKGPTYGFDISKPPEELSDQINALIADLG